jgi:crotonobetainyl-CoA:carnitine CoA-transferase CaiB-like acyl-CoA transferase
MTDEALPLAGLRVVDLSRALAGPFCAMILADLGAEVVKIEPTPEGEMVRKWGPFKDGISVYYLSIHRNKRSLAVNFRDARGLELIRELALAADVVVENFKPGVTREMGLDYPTLARRNPRLVYASITAFGTEGPYGAWPGVDQIAQGMSGLMSLTGQKETGPTRVGIPIADVVAGMWAALGCQAAIIQRQASGKGQLVETSLLAGLIGLLNVQGQRQLTLGDTPGVAGNDHPVICPYGMFEAKDGPFNMAVATEDMWSKLCTLLGLAELVEHPDFKDNSARLRNRDALKRILNAKFATRGKMEWTLELVKLGLPAGPIFTLDQVFRDPHVNETGLVEEIEHPRLGRLRVIANPIRMGAVAGHSVRTPPPALGEHSRQVLRDFGLGEARIDALQSAKVILDAR